MIAPHAATRQPPGVPVDPATCPYYVPSGEEVRQLQPLDRPSMGMAPIYPMEQVRTFESKIFYDKDGKPYVLPEHSAIKTRDATADRRGRKTRKRRASSASSDASSMFSEDGYSLSTSEGGCSCQRSISISSLGSRASVDSSAFTDRSAYSEYLRDRHHLREYIGSGKADLDGLRKALNEYHKKYGPLGAVDRRIPKHQPGCRHAKGRGGAERTQSPTKSRGGHHRGHSHRRGDEPCPVHGNQRGASVCTCPRYGGHGGASYGERPSSLAGYPAGYGSAMIQARDGGYPTAGRAAGPSPPSNGLCGWCCAKPAEETKWDQRGRRLEGYSAPRPVQPWDARQRSASAYLGTSEADIREFEQRVRAPPGRGSYDVGRRSYSTDGLHRGVDHEAHYGGHGGQGYGYGGQEGKRCTCVKRRGDAGGRPSRRNATRAVPREATETSCSCSACESERLGAGRGASGEYVFVCGKNIGPYLSSKQKQKLIEKSFGHGTVVAGRRTLGPKSKPQATTRSSSAAASHGGHVKSRATEPMGVMPRDAGPDYFAPVGAPLHTIANEPSGAYPNQYNYPGHPVGQSGYPVGQSAYPVGQSGHPAAQSGYPAGQSGYPSAQFGYPGQSTYPVGQSAYPVGQAIYPDGQSSAQPGYPGSYSQESGHAYPTSGVPDRAHAQPQQPYAQQPYAQQHPRAQYSVVHPNAGAQQPDRQHPNARYPAAAGPNAGGPSGAQNSGAPHSAVPYSSVGGTMPGGQHPQQHAFEPAAGPQRSFQGVALPHGPQNGNPAVAKQQQARRSGRPTARAPQGKNVPYFFYHPNLPSKKMNSFVSPGATDLDRYPDRQNSVVHHYPRGATGMTPPHTVKDEGLRISSYEVEDESTVESHPLGKIPKRR